MESNYLLPSMLILQLENSIKGPLVLVSLTHTVKKNLGNLRIWKPSLCENPKEIIHQTLLKEDGIPIPKFEIVFEKDGTLIRTCMWRTKYFIKTPEGHVYFYEMICPTNVLPKESYYIREKKDTHKKWHFTIEDIRWRQLSSEQVASAAAAPTSRNEVQSPRLPTPPRPRASAPAPRSPTPPRPRAPATGPATGPAPTPAPVQGPPTPVRPTPLTQETRQTTVEKIIVNHIPQHIFRMYVEQAQANNQECPITMEPFEFSTVGCTPCGHLFQANAIKQYVTQTKKCPTCRKIIRPEDIQTMI